jgi:hypothetical protein
VIPTVWYKFDDGSNIGLDSMGTCNLTNFNTSNLASSIKGDSAALFNGTNQYLNKSLAILDTFQKQDNYKYYKVMYDDKPMINKFNPRVTIDKMTIRFRLPDGKLYSFGGVNNNNTQTVNYVVFKITVLQRFLETKYLNQTDG